MQRRRWQPNCVSFRCHRQLPPQATVSKAHVRDLQSLSDGHWELNSDLPFPHVDPATCLTRFGVGGSNGGNAKSTGRIGYGCCTGRRRCLSRYARKKLEDSKPVEIRSAAIAAVAGHLRPLLANAAARTANDAFLRGESGSERAACRGETRGLAPAPRKNRERG